MIRAAPVRRRRRRRRRARTTPARAAAAAAGGAALAAIAGLLGAVVGTASPRGGSEGRGLGWRIAIQRRDERRAASCTRRRDRDAYGTTVRRDAGEPRRPRRPPRRAPPTDPYHH